MKVIEKKVDVKKDVFPRLATYTDSDIIILLIRNRSGFVVNNNDLRELGYYSDGWVDSNMIDYTGEITLSNN